MADNMKIMPCTCDHPRLDAMHGRWMRPHNFARKALSGAGGWRCIVCLNVKPATQAEREPTKADKKKQKEGTVL